MKNGSNFLFVYGMLQPGRAPAEIRSVVRNLTPAGAGKIPARLFDFGDYPGLVLHSTPQRDVPGRIFRLPEDPEVLRRLDEYEGFHPAEPRQSLFVRKLRLVNLPDGTRRRCWVYLYNRDMNGAREILPAPARKKLAARG